MVKDNFWSEPVDDFSDVQLPINLVRGNTPTFASETNVVQFSPLTIDATTAPSSKPPIITKAFPPAPIIFEDIWGDTTNEPILPEVFRSTTEPIVHIDAKPNIKWLAEEEVLYEMDQEDTSSLSENEYKTSSLLMEAPFSEDPISLGLLREFVTVSNPSTFDNELEQDFLINDIELLDIDAALAELAEEFSPSSAEKEKTGVLIGRGSTAGWMGSRSLAYIDWGYGEEAEQEALKRLGYAELEISEATRAFVLQTARAAGLPYHQEQDLTTKLEQARLLCAKLPNCEEPENDPYARQRAALNAEITDLEQTLVYKMQWVAVKKAVQYVGRGIDLDDLIQYGMLGVIAGVKHYDVNKNARLLVIVNWWVFQSLERAIAETVHLIRIPVYLAEILEYIKKQYATLLISLGRLPTLTGFADVVQIPVERINELLNLNKKLISLERCKQAEYAQEEYSFQSIKNVSAVSEDTFDDEMDKFDIKQNIETMLQLLSMRERQVVTLRYGLYNEEMRTLEEIGKVLNVTRERVRQIQDKAFKKIRKRQNFINECNRQMLSHKAEEDPPMQPIVPHSPKHKKTSGSKFSPEVLDTKIRSDNINIEELVFDYATSIDSIKAQKATDKNNLPSLQQLIERVRKT